MSPIGLVYSEYNCGPSTDDPCGTQHSKKYMAVITNIYLSLFSRILGSTVSNAAVRSNRESRTTFLLSRFQSKSSKNLSMQSLCYERGGRQIGEAPGVY